MTWYVNSTRAMTGFITHWSCGVIGQETISQFICFSSMMYNFHYHIDRFFGLSRREFLWKFLLLISLLNLQDSLWSPHSLRTLEIATKRIFLFHSIPIWYQVEFSCSIEGDTKCRWLCTHLLSGEGPKLLGRAIATESHCFSERSSTPSEQPRVIH